MCGIAGILGKIRYSRYTLTKTSDLLRHRGPDDEGFYIHSAGKEYHCGYTDTVSNIGYLNNLADIDPMLIHDVAFVHRRLSIIDLTNEGHQPFKDNTGNFIITYNGEIYNYLELREELKHLGYIFRSMTDTEVILNSYKEWGEKCVNRFLGMWTFAIYNKLDNTVFFSRDRFGIKPLYYRLAGQNMFFASEIKGLPYFFETSNDINDVSFIHYTYGIPTNDNSTLFQNVYTIPAGCNAYYSLSDSSLTIDKYYDITRTNSNNSATNKNLLEEYKWLLKDSIKLHMRSDVEIGSCLSGGLDSSAIVSIASKNTRSRFKTFTASYYNESIDETKFVRLLAAGTSNIDCYFIYPSSSEYLNNIDKLIWHQDLPIHSSSMFAQWQVMKLANEHCIKVLLDGQGADESLGGYSIFTGVYLWEILKSGNIFSFFSEANKIKNNRLVSPYRELSRVLFHSLPNVIAYFIKDRTRLPYSIFDTDIKIPNKVKSIYSNFLNGSVHNITNGLQELLRYEDKSSMAFSIESRVPFLDHRLVEFSLMINSSLKIYNGYSKYILRKSIENYAPSEIVWRKDKKGFVTPESDWQKEISEIMRQYINECSFPGIIDKKKTLKVFSDYGKNNTFDSQIWKLFAILKWYNIFIANKSRL